MHLESNTLQFKSDKLADMALFRSIPDFRNSKICNYWKFFTSVKVLSMFLEKFKYIFLFLEWNKRSGGMSKLLID